ncbi:hypothetical protein [Telmatospirillum sp.]|uniref:hypothetical protein n=1 Tax=Telmatospirillum sp. TaxID=2079197 RepID=UPI002842E7AD|nr:hypothetical protein [Telmatospirillum sp.]MDR3441150.1 hypothetical protein [Telmatospirillum sp.]
MFLLAALLSSTVGMAMNPALLILVLPFYLLRSVLLLSIRDIVAAMVNICGFSITYWLMMRAGDDSYSSWALTWDHFVSAWQTMVKDGPLTIGPLLVLVLSATLITLRRTACSFFSRKITGQYTEVTRFSLVVASFVYIFFVINMGHAETGTAHRYIYWVIVALITISVDIHFEWLANFLIFRKDRAALLRLGERCLPAFGVILAISVILLRTAPWSERIHYLLVDSAIRPLAAVATAARTAFIVGDYWKTWPVVVETLAARQAAGEPRPLVFGMTFRGETVRDLADREFRQAASRSALCIDQSADQCAQQLLSIIPPFSWKECVTTVDAGQVPGASYTVIRLVREEAGQSCAGLEASSSWADLRSFARLTLSAYRQGNDIILPQEAPLGLTVYGPYLHLDPGHFNASWRLSVAAFGDGVTEDTPIAKVDIADKTGADLLGDRLLTRRDFKPGPDGYSATVTLPFRAKHPLEHLELRLFRLAPVTITLAGLSVASASD